MLGPLGLSYLCTKVLRFCANFSPFVPIPTCLNLNLTHPNLKNLTHPNLKKLTYPNLTKLTYPNLKKKMTHPNLKKMTCPNLN